MIERLHMHPARRRLLELVETAGSNLVELSHRLGRNDAYLQQYIHRGSPQELAYEDRLLLAEWLSCSLGEITIDKAKLAVSSSNQGTVKTVYKGQTTPLTPGKDDLPIYGHTTAGRTGQFMNKMNAVGRAERPGELTNVPAAYAVRIWTRAMEPAFLFDRLAYVDPSRPVLPGDDVIVLLKTGEFLILNLIAKTERSVRGRQYNPPVEIEHPSADIEAVDLIVSTSRTRA